MMTRKDFIELADILKKLKTPPTTEVLNALCYFCKGQDHNFNSYLWRQYLLGYCGPHGGPVEKEKHNV